MGDIWQEYYWNDWSANTMDRCFHRHVTHPTFVKTARAMLNLVVSRARLDSSRIPARHGHPAEMGSRADLAEFTEKRHKDAPQQRNIWFAAFYLKPCV